MSSETVTKASQAAWSRLSSYRRRNTCTFGQLTRPAHAFEHSCTMSNATFTGPRRSGRVFHKMQVQAQGRGHDGRKFREVCQTMVVNSHGGLLLLKHEIDQGEMIVLTNPETDEEQECRVVFLGEPNDNGQRVGVEFLTPAPRFWGLEFADGLVASSGQEAAV